MLYLSTIFAIKNNFEYGIDISHGTVNKHVPLYFKSDTVLRVKLIKIFMQVRIALHVFVNHCSTNGMGQSAKIFILMACISNTRLSEYVLSFSFICISPKFS